MNNANRFEAFQFNDATDKSENEVDVKVDKSDSDSENESDSEELDREIAKELNELDRSIEEMDPCLFVLTNSNGYPIYCSASRTLLVAERSDLVQQAIAEYSILGRCYVSYETNDEEDICTISCMQRNLFWTTERVLESYTIYRVPKI